LLAVTRAGMKTGPFGSLLKKHEHRTAGVPVVGIENISQMRFVPGTKVFITFDKASQLSEYALFPGDIVISRSGTVGEVCIIPEGLGQARMSTNVMRIVLATHGMLASFFCMLFNGSPFVLNQISELCSGSTRDFLNQTILSSIVFPLPPLSEQYRIVAEVERRLSVVAELEATVAANLVRAGRLRQAVLKRAFEGRLVPQDPSDEPAEALLAGIRATRANVGARSPRPQRAPHQMALGEWAA
jgi:type I restriction enzyme S subunit